MNRQMSIKEQQTALDVIEAARCIRHWHDTGRNNEGMIVSSEHVRILWQKLSKYDDAAAEAERCECKEKR